MMPHDELSEISARYSRRTENSVYSMLRTEVYLAYQERFSGIVDIIRSNCGLPPQDLKLVDLGCGTGGNLLDFLRIGFAPENLVGLELLDDRVSAARNLLPASLKVVGGDAVVAPIADASVDIVFQSVVFSSLLSDDFQVQMANAMWRWVKPGGGVLWYDFVYNNPKNADVRGVPLSRIKALFPDAKITAARVTLAPPIARRIARMGHFPHHLLHAIPFLRTHLLVWIEK
jgi:SAM-dependent methyltransferase